jgi:hypothetical protein
VVLARFGLVFGQHDCHDDLDGRVFFFSKEGTDMLLYMDGEDHPALFDRT